MFDGLYTAKKPVRLQMAVGATIVRRLRRDAIFADFPVRNAGKRDFHVSMGKIEWPLSSLRQIFRVGRQIPMPVGVLSSRRYIRHFWQNAK